MDKIASALVKQAGGIELITERKIEEAVKKLPMEFAARRRSFAH